MNRPTISYAAEWDAIAIEHPREPRYSHCPACGSLRRSGSGPHAPRWLDGRQVDCSGLEVRP